MITEDYVSNETFKLLKEKGFDDSCCRFVIESDETYHRGAPTLQMAMKWLRKIHNIHIAIVPCEVGPGVMDYTYVLYKVDIEKLYFEDLEIQGRANTDKMSASKTCEAAIEYCLEHLI